MASPSSWLSALVYPSPDAMKIINNNLINSNNSNNSNCDPVPSSIPNKILEKNLPIAEHLNKEHLMEQNNSNNESSEGLHNNNALDSFLNSQLNKEHINMEKKNSQDNVLDTFLNSQTNDLHNDTNDQFSHNNILDNDGKEDKYLSLPKQSMHRNSRDEYSARRHRSIDIPFSFTPTAPPDVIAELQGDDLKAHLEQLSAQTLQQQRSSRRSKKQDCNTAFLEESNKTSNSSNMGDNFNFGDNINFQADRLSFQPAVSQWIDHSNFSQLEHPHFGLGSNVFDSEKEKTDVESMEKIEKLSSKIEDMSILVRQHLVQVENRLFEMFGDKEKQTININKFLMGLMATGLRHSDPRLKEMRKNLKKVQERLAASDPHALDVDYETFMGIISDNLEIVVKAFSSSFVIPDFKGFCRVIDEIYYLCQANQDGKVASYIPQLARSNPNHFGVSICTVDGQRYAMGDVNVPFTVQSCSKPLNYAMALGMTNTDFIHNYVGMEPSGRYFNELCLDYSNKPHNPMINAGAIMTASLIKPNLSAADRFDYVFNLYKRLVAGEYLGFNNAVFLSERECADRNFALAYFMRENKCFPEGTRLHETLDFYFQLCSMEITTESGALIAATLANGGINPLTGDPVLTVEAVRNTLTLMHSCGMYNYSGQFAFKVGLPSKSGVSGCVLVVVPNTMGICLWSPPLDDNGNSCRSVQFCMELVSRFTFHNFDNLRGHISTKIDPRMAKAESKAQILFDLLFSAAAGDLSALRRHSLSGTDMEAKDYDGRTALHVAASEGHFHIVEYLLKNCDVNPLPKDRWDRTPLDDSRSFGHPRCATMIEESCSKKGIDLPLPITAHEIKIEKA